MLSFRQRLARDEGFTLIELLVVLIIIGNLLSIAIPSYLGFQKKAQQTAAMSDVRSAIPDAEAYYSDQTPNSYTGMTAAGLRTNYDSGLQVIGVNGAGQGISKAEPGSGGAQTFCISANVSGHWAFVNGPGGQVVNGDTQNPVVTADPCP
jgi:prepilin-type N-terminal cleavage/methylation domain-containing protein